MKENTSIISSQRLNLKPIGKLVFGVAFAYTSQLHASLLNLNCRNLFNPIGRIEVIAPDEKDLGKRYEDDAKEVAEIASKLGLAVPNHQVNIVPSGQLNILAANGGHAIPHFISGSKVLAQAQKSQGVLEFVTDGCEYCRAFYSASTGRVENRSVFMHVAGHNDQSKTSMYQLVRTADGPLASYQLAQTITKAYAQHSHDEVSLYYQWMESFIGLQDFSFGTFEQPDKFKNKQLLQSTYAAQNSKINDPANWHKSLSPLQALTQFLPEHAPQWKKDIFSQYEKMVRVYPAIFQTKILNEGWATLMQYIIARYKKDTTSADLVQYAQLMSGVAYPSFENPYWIGVTGWFNLYEQFRERPEIAKLSELEKDQHFIFWARQLYSNKNDSEWARIALDRKWIEKRHLFIYRPTQKHEMQAGIKPEDQANIVVTRDWKRIQDYIIDNYVDQKLYSTPSVSILNPNTTPGYIQFNQEKVKGDIPFHLGAALKTLFVYSKTFEKPVQLNALFLKQITGDTSSPSSFQNLPGQMKVFPNGQVEFHFIGDSEPTSPELLKYLTKVLQDYQADVNASFEDGLGEAQFQNWTQLSTQVADLQGDRALNIVQFAPFTGPAIREYLQVVEKRLQYHMKNILNGKEKLRIVGNNVRVRVMPEVPSFRYDLRQLEAEINEASQENPTPVDGARLHTSMYHIRDYDGKIGSGKKSPGDRFKGKEQSGGQGEGEGEPAGGNPKPSEIDIPLKMYGELLKNLLGIPNIKRTDSDNHETIQIKRGRMNKPNGQIVWDDVIINAYVKAIAKHKALGESFENIPVVQLVREGLKLLEREDYVVKAKADKEIPKFSLVVVINLDVTGSMNFEDRIQQAQNIIFNFKALMAATYDKIIYRYVHFTTEAKEVSEKDFFKKFDGGGTEYAVSIKKDEEILSEYPTSKYNKVILTVGDGDTHDAKEYADAILNLSPELQYVATAIVGSNPASSQNLFSAIESLKQSWKWTEIAHMKSDSELIETLQKLFPKEKKAEH